MNKERKEKVYQVGRLKRLVNLIKGEDDSNQTRVLEVKPETSPKKTTRKLSLRIRYLKILHHQKGEIYLTILLQVLNNENLSNYRNAKYHTTPCTIRIRKEIPVIYTLYKRRN